MRRAQTATNRTLPTANAELDLYAPGSKPLAPLLKKVFKFGEAVVVISKTEFDKLLVDAEHPNIPSAGDNGDEG